MAELSVTQGLVPVSNNRVLDLSPLDVGICKLPQLLGLLQVLADAESLAANGSYEGSNAPQHVK